MMSARKAPWAGIAAGAALIAAWFEAMHTTRLIAYKGGTLAQVHALCGSGVGQFGRLLNVRAAAECNSIDNTAQLWNIIGLAGLLLAVACGAWLIWQHRATTPATPASGGRQRGA